MVKYVVRWITRQQAEEWGLPFEIEALSRELISNGRWSSTTELVFRAPDDNETWFVRYDEPLTENQEIDLWNDAHYIFLTLVEPHVETRTCWRKVRVEEIA